MALHVNQENTRTKLQQRIADDLAEKAKKKALNEGDRPDGVTDSADMQGTKQTTSLAGAWVLIALVAVGVIIWLVVISL